MQAVKLNTTSAGKRSIRFALVAVCREKLSADDVRTEQKRSTTAGGRRKREKMHLVAIARPQAKKPDISNPFPARWGEDGR